MTPQISKPKFTIWNDEDNRKKEAQTSSISSVTPKRALKRSFTLPTRPRGNSDDDGVQIKRRKSTSDLAAEQNASKPAILNIYLKTLRSSFVKIQSRRFYFCAKKRFTFSRRFSCQQITSTKVDQIIATPVKNPQSDGDKENRFEKEIRILLSHCDENKTAEVEEVQKVEEIKPKLNKIRIKTPETASESENDSAEGAEKLLQLCRSPRKQILTGFALKTQPQPKKLTFNFRSGEKTLFARRKPRVSLWKKVIMKQHNKSYQECLRSNMEFIYNCPIKHDGR